MRVDARSMHFAGRLAVFGSLVLLSTGSMAHHSFAGFYDPNDIVEIEGTVTSISWRNPHGSMTIDVTGPDGETVEWRIETGSISVLRIRGVGREFLSVGDHVRVAGEAALRRRAGLYARNMLLDTGEEVMLSIGIAPRWTDAETGALLEPRYDRSVAAEAEREARGIFRVWSTVLDDPDSFPLFKGGYPLTARARELKSRWDASNVVQLGCEPKGMPSLMITPYPIEFVDRGAEIVLRFEEDDAERIIHMSPEARRPDGFASPLGFSTGRWEDNALVVETDGISAPYFDYEGTPQSAAIRLIERFELNERAGRIDYRLSVDDPETFTEAFSLTRYFIWRPELSVNPYDCIVRE